MFYFGQVSSVFMLLLFDLVYVMIIVKGLNDGFLFYDLVLVLF